MASSDLGAGKKRFLFNLHCYSKINNINTADVQRSSISLNGNCVITEELRLNFNHCRAAPLQVLANDPIEWHYP